MSLCLDFDQTLFNLNMGIEEGGPKQVKSAQGDLLKLSF